MRLAVGNALADADTLEQGFEAVLAAAGGALGWELGAAWLPDASGQAMRCAATWTVDADPRYRSLAHSLELRPGRGLVGETWASGEPRWIADVYDELDNPAHPHAAAMRDVGVRSLASVPLMGLDGVVAVLQLLSREPREPDEHTLQTLLAIGEQVGHAVYRRLARMETDRMKDEFLALVSHELRTPLTSIVGYLELLRDEETELGSIESERFLGVIGRNAARLQRLVDDVLFAARAEAGKMGLAERAIDLASVARESVLAAHPKADEVGVELRLDSEEMLETVGDPDRLGQALDNLISNALKFTPPGGRVDVRVRTVAERVEIEVRDTGLGMAATDLERVFDRFFRSPATRDQVPGAGLGLTIVKTIVEAHGGTIAVASSEGVGTAFLIDLPLVPVGVAATWPPRRA
jgi:signal transduction histidine kinase